MLWMLLLALSGSMSLSSGLRVLSVLPFPQKSHHIMFNALLGALVDRGHQVTVYSGYRINMNHTNYTHHLIRTTLDDSLGNCNYENKRKGFDSEPIFQPSVLHTGPVSQLSEETLNLPMIRKLISSNETFDIVILETMFGQEALIGLGHRFKAPVVTLNSLGSNWLMDCIMGNPTPLAYLAHFMHPYGSRLTFLQRVKSFLYYLTQMVYSHTWYYPNQQLVYDRHFTAASQAPLPPLMELLTETAVVLLNTRPEVSHARALVPNMVNVGGLHIPKLTDPLPQRIQEFMDDADKGVIYFSLGSTFSGGSMPENILKTFITVFKSIPQRILWKIDNPPSNLPPNIMTVQWAPQTSVLAHRSCVAFITHGGLLSLLEAAHFAIPLVGIALFADQGFNVAKVEEAGIGVRLRITSLSTASVAEALDQVLHNPMYKRNMERLSASMRDVQVSPLDTAIHWVEFVVRHKGAPHLRSPARHISFVQRFMIDVVLLLSLVVLCFIVILKQLYRIILWFCFKPSKYVKKNKVN